MWLRLFSRKIFGKMMGSKPPEKAKKYMDIARMVYFFSASSVAILYYFVVRDELAREDMERNLLMGLPVIEDISPAHKKLRESGVKTAILYNHVVGEGLETIEYDRDLYLQELEKQALKRAQEAQRKLLEEGKDLPPGAIKLVQ